MSIPRDLKVQIPGAGTGKINSAYEIGGPRKTVSTIKRLFKDATGENFPINHVITVNFGGFRRAVNYVGGVYVDIDRRYYNDNSTAAPGEAYATIDVQPGYQKLKGQDALDYVRYRHGDNDFFRASRQQDFLRQISHQDAVRALLDVEQAQGARAHLRALLRGRRVLREGVEPDRAGEDWACSWPAEGAGQRGPLPRHRGREPGDRLLPLRQGLRPAQDRRRVHDRQGLVEPAPPRRDDQARQADRRQAQEEATSRPSVKGLEQAPTEGENMAVLVESQNKLGFPFYFPALRKTGSRYADPKPRIYAIRDGQNKLHRAYRLTLNAGAYSEYYGVQGMTWKIPPILDDPDRVRDVNGRKLSSIYDGSHLRLVAWRTSKAVYWVTNTLTMSIPNSRLIAIASSLRRLKS